MINGKNFDWEDVKIFFNGVPITDIDEINYNDEQEWEAIYGSGARPIGAGRGNYKAGGDLTLKKAAYDTLNAIAKAAGKTIFDFKPGLIVVVYGAKTIVDGSDFVEPQYPILSTDTLVNVIFNKRNFGSKQNDKSHSVKIEFLCEKII